MVDEALMAAGSRAHAEFDCSWNSGLFKQQGIPRGACREGRTQDRFGPLQLLQPVGYDFDDSLWRFRVSTFSTTRSTSVRKKPLAGWRTATFVP